MPPYFSFYINKHKNPSFSLRHHTEQRERASEQAAVEVSFLFLGKFFQEETASSTAATPTK